MYIAWASFRNVTLSTGKQQRHNDIIQCRKQSPCKLSFVYTSCDRARVRDAILLEIVHCYFHIKAVFFTHVLSYAAYYNH